MDDSDYGFFCDVETAIINDYEKVEYYVAATRTRYEVRRKIIRKFEITKEPANEPEKEADDKSGDEISCFPAEEKREDVVKPTCLSLAWKRLARIPKDIYYSFLVCSVTASCVVFVMTYEFNEPK